MLIAFCGIDGSGKSSHSKEVSKWLKDVGEQIETLNPIKDSSSFYNSFIEARIRYEKKCNKPMPNEYDGILLAFEFFRRCKEIEDMIDEGKIVVADRWVYSHYVYTYARNVKNDFIFSLLEGCRNPELVFLLDVPGDIALDRIDRRGLRGYNEEREILNKARKKYLELAEEKGFIILDSTNPFEYNQEIIKNSIKQKLILHTENS